MYLVASHLQHWHLCKHVRIFAIARDKTVYSLFALRAFDAYFASSKHEARCKTFQVPFERRTNGLIEIVDVKDEPSIRSSVGAQVAHMSIATNLVHNSRVRKQRKIGSHNRHSAAKKSEGRGSHALIFQ